MTVKSCNESWNTDLFMVLPTNNYVMLCGLICGYVYGLMEGFIVSVLRSSLPDMPVTYQWIIVIANTVTIAQPNITNLNTP